MLIGCTDQKETRVQKKRFARQLRNVKENENSELMDTVQISELPSEPTTESDSSAEEVTPISQSIKRTSKADVSVAYVSKRPRLSNLALACDRTGVSDRAAALISSSILQNYGIIPPLPGSRTSKDVELENVIDRNKIRRARSKSRKHEAECSLQINDIESIYFDGRRDETIINEKRGDTNHRKNIMKEHISIISEPGNEFLCHIGVERGTSQCIIRAILDFFNEHEIATESIIAIGCDGTAVNIGTKGGIIRQLEMKLRDHCIGLCVNFVRMNCLYDI
jgi:hypothetical protein